jgi:cytochrome c-type biogenesis protein CcmE
MMTRKQKRLAVIGGGMSFLALAAVLVFTALRDEMVFFHSPTALAENAVAPGTRIRLGGLIADGSIERGQGRLVQFAVEDGGNQVHVRYDGLLPDLFREGQGVIAEGAFTEGDTVFVADTILAKHDETYMPREVADMLKEQGVWQGEDAAN